MPGIGSYEYPDTSVGDAIEAAKKIARQFKTAPFDRSALSALLGYKSASSGTFNQRLADFRRFGLLEGRADEIRATELAQTLAAPTTSDEYSRAVAEVIFKIPLYQSLYDMYGPVSPGEEELFATLLNLTKADRLEVKKQAGRIRSLYAEAVSKISDRGAVARQSTVGAGRGGGRQISAQPSTSMIEFRAGEIHQSVPFTPTGVDLMARILGDQNFWKFLREHAQRNVEDKAEDSGEI